MRITNGSGQYHLTYCTNIHPGEEWGAVFRNLQTYIPQLKQRLSPEASFGIGLRLSGAASEALLMGDHLQQLQEWLTRVDCYVFTLNGFPYGGFHHQIVKDQVYAPDWSKGDRLSYSQRLLRILATLLPSGLDGGISTVPLSYKSWWAADNSSIFDVSSRHLAQIAAEMAEIEAQTGQYLHLDLEPEPDALLENTDEVIAFFQRNLLKEGKSYLQQQYGLNAQTAETWLRRHICVCYDTCHFAVEYEDPATALAKLQAAGIAIGKFQLSSAIRVPIPTDLAQRQGLRQRLEAFAESTYLHQVIERQASGALRHYPDLGEALPLLATSDAVEWRTHFHVPIFIDQYPPLASTQSHIIDQYPPLASTQSHISDILRHLSLADCTHLEIETYTWDVLPTDMKVDIVTSIEREYKWVLAALPNRQSQVCP